MLYLFQYIQVFIKMYKKIINLDNASNTIIRKKIKKVFFKILNNKFLSNPSSFHFLGRKSKYYIEISREKISKLINCNPEEILFTYGGTSGNNIIIKGVINYYNLKYIITSKLEHISVLKTILNFKKKIKIIFLKNDKFGNLNLKQLENILKKKSEKKKYRILVSIMYINNEIGNINNIKKIGNLCLKYNALFHSDFVQFVGHYKLNVEKINCNFFSVSAHKFYGPLGIGFIFVKNGFFLEKFILGGNQEKGIISGSENIYGIICLYKALKISLQKLKKERKYILKLKKYCINLLKKNIKNIKYNGLSNKIKKSSYSILNLRLPIRDKLLHIKLDLQGIIVSKGSSCYNNKESHVIKNILKRKDLKETTSIRISFSFLNKKKDIKIFVKKLKKIIFKKYDKKFLY